MTKKQLLAAAVCAAAVLNLGGERAPMLHLPKPHYAPQHGDPGWLSKAVQFHGHLGPWATAGVRAGMAGLRAVGAQGYFDVEVTCEGPMLKPPKSCFLDGLQVGTGATLGKRNLTWVEAENVMVRVKNTRSGRVANLRPTAELLELLTSFAPDPKAQDGDHGPSEDHEGHSDHDPGTSKEDPIEVLARRIAAMPDEALFTVRSENP